MSKFNKILCPVDLSDNSLAAIDLATMLALHNQSQVVFIYVAPPLLPEEAMFGSEYVRQTVEENKEGLKKVTPADPAVPFEHIFVSGNPGPEIVRASKDCDLIVMSTHGFSGIMRLLMGSVAQYVMRHSKCPVIMFKNQKIKRSEREQEVFEHKFVTEVMHQVSPIQGFDKMTEVLADMNQARQTAAPVVDETGKCIGILTKTDIDKYFDLKKRYEAGDQTVIDEMFEVDQYGQRRPNLDDFDQVRRHMTFPVVSITNDQPCAAAKMEFDENPNIHHLVVVDETNHALGVVEPDDVKSCGKAETDSTTSQLTEG